MSAEIIRGCGAMEMHEFDFSEPELLVKGEGNTRYEIAFDCPCDRSDLASLNMDLEDGKLTILMKLELPNLRYNYLVKDSNGHVSAVEMVEVCSK